MRGIEQQIDVLASPAGELVDGPDREGRLAQLLHLRCLGPPPLLPQRTCQSCSLGHEISEIDAVKAIQLVFEIHRHANSFAMHEARGTFKAQRPDTFRRYFASWMSWR